jgi:hypothetical protein
MARVERKVVGGDSEVRKEFGPATVKVFLKDGKVLETTVEKARGNPANPMSLEEIQGKYKDCCKGVLADDATERSLALLQRLDQVSSIRELMACYRVP